MPPYIHTITGPTHVIYRSKFYIVRLARVLNNGDINLRAYLVYVVVSVNSHVCAVSLLLIGLDTVLYYGVLLRTCLLAY